MSIYKVNLPDEDSKTTVTIDKIMKFREGFVGKTIIFVRRSDDGIKLRKKLVECGYAAITLGDDDSDKLMRDFKAGLTQVFVTSRLLGWEFDHSQVNLVVNLDLPLFYNKPKEPFYEVYLKRISGKEVVFNLLSGDYENMIMEKIERHYNLNVTEVPWASDGDFDSALKLLCSKFSCQLLI